jgi:hypothetical protein
VSLCSNILADDCKAMTDGSTDRVGCCVTTT